MRRRAGINQKQIERLIQNIFSGSNNQRPTAPNSAPVQQPSYASAVAPNQPRPVNPQATTIPPLTMPTNTNSNSVQPSVGTPVESIISGHSASMASPMSGSVASPLAPSVTPSYANVVASNMTPPPMSAGKIKF